MLCYGDDDDVDDGRDVVDASFSLELFVSLSSCLSLVNRLRKKPTLETHPLLCRRADSVHAFAGRLSHVVDRFMCLMDDVVGTFRHCVRNFFNLNNFKRKSRHFHYQYCSKECVQQVSHSFHYETGCYRLPLNLFYL